MDREEIRAIVREVLEEVLEARIREILEKENLSHLADLFSREHDPIRGTHKDMDGG